MKSLQISTEEEGGKQVEQEVVIYAKIGNVEGLKQATKIEHHKQAQIKTSVGSIRVRYTKPQDFVQADGKEGFYDQTTKVPMAGEGVKKMEEHPLPISEELFNQFLDVAPTYMDKTRYSFKAEKVTIGTAESSDTLDIGDLWFEVDVFKKADGTESEWCKIDVEIQGVAEKLKGTPFENQKLNFKVSIGKLPFAPSSFVLEGGTEDPKKKALITQLYETEFLIKNPRLKA